MCLRHIHKCIQTFHLHSDTLKSVLCVYVCMLWAFIWFHCRRCFFFHASRALSVPFHSQIYIYVMCVDVVKIGSHERQDFEFMISPQKANYTFFRVYVSIRRYTFDHRNYAWHLLIVFRPDQIKDSMSTIPWNYYFVWDFIQLSWHILFEIKTFFSFLTNVLLSCFFFLYLFSN